MNCCYPTNKAIHYITMQHDSADTMDEEMVWGAPSVFKGPEGRGDS
jgi:hypothetical protein